MLSAGLNDTFLDPRLTLFCGILLSIKLVRMLRSLVCE